MNICMEYQYRDAGNYKILGEVVFHNQTNMTAEAVECKIRELLIDHEFFVAEVIGITPLRFETWDDDLDHGWHTFDRTTATTTQATDVHQRDIRDFIVCIEMSRFNEY